MKRLKQTILFPAVLVGMMFILACAGTRERDTEIAREGEIHLQIGTNYLTKGNLEMAHFELNKAARMIPKNPEVHFALGTLHVLRKDLELAIQEFQRTLELNPRYADAYNNLAVSYLQTGQFDEAINAGERALEEVTYETPEKAMTIIGWAYYKKGDPAKALDFLKRALETRPQHPDAENKMATIFLEQGNTARAKEILLGLVERVPRFSGARLNLGMVYFKERDVLAARREFNAVMDLVDPKSEEGRLAQGYLDLIE